MSDAEVTEAVFSQCSGNGETLDEEELRTALAKIAGHFGVGLDIDKVMGQFEEQLDEYPTLEARLPQRASDKGLTEPSAVGLGRDSGSHRGKH